MTGKKKKSKTRRTAGKPATGSQAARYVAPVIADDGGGADADESVVQELGTALAAESIPALEAKGDVLPIFAAQAQAAEATSVTDNTSFDDAANAWFGEYGSSISRATVQQHPSAEFMQEVIIGRDDRVRVPDPTLYPFSPICALDITASNGRRFVGTGWLADPQTVITAGHCVFMHRQGGWARSIDVFPSRDGNSIPHRRRATRLYSVRGWVSHRQPPSDYAAIRLEDPIPEVGHFGYAALAEDDLLRYRCHIVGYPGDKPRTMWGHARRLKEVRSRTIVYEIDTYGGNSGGPVFISDGGDYLVLGIHNYGDLSGNSATRITAKVYDRIRDWVEN